MNEDTSSDVPSWGGCIDCGKCGLTTSFCKDCLYQGRSNRFYVMVEQEGETSTQEKPRAVLKRTPTVLRQDVGYQVGPGGGPYIYQEDIINPHQVEQRKPPPDNARTLSGYQSPTNYEPYEKREFKYGTLPQYAQTEAVVKPQTVETTTDERPLRCEEFYPRNFTSGANFTPGDTLTHCDDDNKFFESKKHPLAGNFDVLIPCPNHQSDVISDIQLPLNTLLNFYW